MSKETEVRINVRVPVDLKRRVKAEAALRGLKLSDVVRDLLEKWIQISHNRQE